MMNYTLINFNLKHYCLKEDESMLLFGYMASLSKETSFDSTAERFPISERFDYRYAVAYLAASWYRYCYKKNAILPPVIQEWYDICHSDNEFPKLRNVWQEKMNL